MVLVTVIISFTGFYDGFALTKSYLLPINLLTVKTFSW